MFAQASIVALFAAVACAQHAPVGQPNGNAIIKPGLQEQVPACKPYTITWQPTTPNSVSLILLRGPSENVVPLQTIVVGIANSGTYSWTPPSSLEADTSRYGLQLIDDITGQFQYSTQFGISKGADCNGFVASSSSSSKYNGGGYPASTPTPPPSKPGSPASSPSPPSNGNSTASPPAPPAAGGSGAPGGAPGGAPAGAPGGAPGSAASGYPVASGSILPLSNSTASRTGGASASRSPSPTRSPPPESTGAASSLEAGFSFVGAAAALMAFML